MKNRMWIQRGAAILTIASAIGFMGCEGSDEVNGPEGRFDFINTSSTMVTVSAAGDEVFGQFTLNPGQETSLSHDAVVGNRIQFTVIPPDVTVDSTSLDNTVIFSD